MIDDTLSRMADALQHHLRVNMHDWSFNGLHVSWHSQGPKWTYDGMDFYVVTDEEVRSDYSFLLFGESLEYSAPTVRGVGFNVFRVS